MKNTGGSVTVTEHDNYTRVEIMGRDGGKTAYSYKTRDGYFTQFLSVENLRYYVARNDIDEEDDYLLYHAMQEDKRVACSFWTRNEQLIFQVFSDPNRYNVVSKDTWKKGFKNVYVARKGCLRDFFDIEEISDWYDEMRIWHDEEVFCSMCEAEIITLLTSEFKHPFMDCYYSPVIDFEGDDVLLYFGATSLMVSGLLFGYPLESTVDLIGSLDIY